MEYIVWITRWYRVEAVDSMAAHMKAFDLEKTPGSEGGFCDIKVGIDPRRLAKQFTGAADSADEGR